jgi:hypothetical protein
MVERQLRIFEESDFAELALTALGVVRTVKKSFWSDLMFLRSEILNLFLENNVFKAINTIQVWGKILKVK